MNKDIRRLVKIYVDKIEANPFLILDFEDLDIFFVDYPHWEKYRYETMTLISKYQHQVKKKHGRVYN